MFKRRIAREFANAYTFREGEMIMRPEDLLINYRYCSNHFNKGEYPKLIERITEDLKTYFDSKTSSDDLETSLTQDVDAILDEIESNMEAQRFKFRRKSVFADDHIVLSLFVVPAAAKMGTAAAQKFCELLSKRFVERFPGTTFKVGNYDEIMEGFKWKISLTLNR